MDTFINVNKKFISRELQIEINNFEIITQITSNCYDILGYTDNEILNTNISKYFKYNFDNLVTTENFNAKISRKDGIKRFLIYMQLL